MGLFDGLQKRAQIVTEGNDGGIQGLTGLWARGFARKNSELAAIQPARDEVLTASSVAARGIDLFVQAAVSRPFEIVTANGEPVTHYLEELFNKSPNPSQSAQIFWTEFWTLMYTRGEAFIVLDRGQNRVGQPRSAYIHYGDVKVVLTVPTVHAPHGEIARYEVPVNGKYEKLAPSEVIWTRFPDPANPWTALAPIAAALDSIGMVKAAKAWQAGQLSNAGNPSGIVYLGDPGSQEAAELAMEDARAVLEGPSSSGRILALAGTVKPEFTRTSFTADEVGYLDTISAASDDIALALGIPLDLIGGQRTYANVETSWRMFWEGTVLPKLGLVASEINRQMLSGTSLTARFNTDNVTALQEGKDAVAARIAKAVELDVVTIDEARASLGFDPMPNGDGDITLSAYKASLVSVPAPVAAAPVRAIPETAERAVRLSDASENANPDTDTENASKALTEAPTASEGQADIIEVRGITEKAAIRAFDRLEATAHRAVQRLAEAQRKEAKKRLNRATRSADIPADAYQVFNEAAWVERAQEFILPALFAALEAGVDGTAASLGVDITIDNFITQAANARAEALSTLVNKTTVDVLNKRLAAAAIADRVTVKEFASIIDATFDDLAGHRADTIARTEMVGTFNAGSRAAAMQSGVTTAREWLATTDARTRDSHANLNGVRTVSMDDRYPNGLMFPGDPSGSPSETVNCRCVEQYVTSYTSEGK